MLTLARVGISVRWYTATADAGDKMPSRRANARISPAGHAAAISQNIDGLQLSDHGKPVRTRASMNIGASNADWKRAREAWCRGQHRRARRRRRSPPV